FLFDHLGFSSDFAEPRLVQSGSIFSCQGGSFLHCH
ncbi:MAG: hypothetical protein ACI8P9_003991, partial [Parasphingorhabdus sp.]